MKKIFLFIVIPLSVQLNCLAQNDIQFSNYMFSEITLNPAMAGNTETLDAALIARQQWAGFDNAPRTQLLNVHSYVDKVKGGLGLNIINDKLGFEHSLNFKIMYAYMIRINEKSRLSLGLGFGMLNKTLKGSELIYDDMTDVNAVYTNDSKTKPDFDFGLAYYSDKLCVSVSSSHISQPQKNATILNVPAHYYLYAKYKIKASEKINVIPSLKFKATPYITQTDISAIMYYSNKFWAGATFRPGDAVIGLIGVDVTKNLRVGYSYDYNSGGVKNYSDGSHEVVLQASFDVARKFIETKTPRFFN